MELYISCKQDKYDLYDALNKYFHVEILEDEENTMGIGDFKILIEPITKIIDTLGNIIVSIVNTKRSTITIKNGEKEFIFDGKLSELESDEVANIITKLLEV